MTYKQLLQFISAIQLIAVLHLSGMAAETVNFRKVVFVSQGGKDTNSGDAHLRDQLGERGPVATLKRALELVRHTGTALQPARIILEAGAYEFSEALVVSSLHAPLFIEAEVPGAVRLSGSRRITPSRPKPSNHVLSRIPERARPHIVELQLHAAGLPHPGRVSPRGIPAVELFFQGERMPMARWPDTGWLLIAGVPQTGDSLYNKGLDREKRHDGVPVGRHYGRIAYDGDRPSRWTQPSGALLHGYWTWDWSDSYQYIESIDTTRREITIAPPHHHYGYTKKQRYAFLNIPEELDQPGEWYLEADRPNMYWWPPTPPEGHSPTVSFLEQPLLILDSVAQVAIRGLVIQESRGKGIVVRNSRDCSITDCEFRNLGDDAVWVDNGLRIVIGYCTFKELGRGGVMLSGGDRQKLTDGGNIVTDSHFHHYSRWLLTGQYAVMIDGVGNTVQHCNIHDAPFEGLYVRGNNHRIEFNDIHHLLTGSGDAGALHTGRNWTWRGNIIRYNYWHHLKGPGLHGVVGVYLDDWASGFEVYGNVFEEAGRGVLVGGGRDNHIVNNIFLDCTPATHIDARALSWAHYYFDGTYAVLFQGLEEVQHNRPPYSIRYPELSRILDESPSLPLGNRFTRNVCLGGRWMDIYDFHAFDVSIVTITDNYLAAPILLRRRSDGEQGMDPYYLDIDRVEGYDAFRNDDPSMKTFFKGNFLVNSAPPLRRSSRGVPHVLLEDLPPSMGFEPIPVDSIGPRRR